MGSVIAPDQALEFILVDQDAIGRAVEIFELTIAHRPEEHDQPQATHGQRNWDQKDQSAQRAAAASRSELPTTTTELSDIAAAAISGVT